MSSKTHWGIIGPGKIAKKFAEALQNASEAELYAVASRKEESARLFAQKYGAECYYGSYEQLVQDPKVDIIYIATPHAFHKEHTLLCLNNKKPVLCEKPLAHKYSEVKEMIKASASNNTFLMEAMWTRFLPPVNQALELIKGGHIGQVQHLIADFGFDSPFDAKSRLYDISLGGGSLMDVGVYPLFLALTVLGEPLNIKATASLSETGADKDCTIVLNYPQVKADLFSSIVSNTKLEAVITGSEGNLRFASPWYRQTYLLLEKNDGTKQEFNFNHSGNGFEDQIIEAISCLKKGVIESVLMPHKFSLLQSKVLDEICRQCGIVYP
ncbi:MAG TPA: Gfo/Idh/MocA family oxidoreductase [Cytophagaceae bacterium]|jgi:predicted dehydrogenase|nr:Gfo/Idh/MocA family oxidoreductase [Cytophagaceae bacterium]